MRSSVRKVVFTGLVCVCLAACGGGGGGGSANPPPPLNTTPPTAAISAITPTQRVANQTVTFSGTGTTVTGGVLTYAWNFGDGATASGSNSTHDYSTPGNFTVTLRVTDAGGLSTEAAQAITLVGPPTTPAVVVAGGGRVPNSSLSFSTSAIDPQGGAITFAWNFGDGAAGTGATVTHTYTTAGSFNVQVTATNALGLTSTSAAPPVIIAWVPVTRPSLILFNDGHFAGQTLFAGAAFVEPNGLPFVLEWDFGDSSTASATDTNATVHHTYTAPGTYSVRVTGTSAAGQVVSEARTVTVRAPPPAPAAISDNVLQPYCAGDYCAATDSTTYNGHGVGVWRYHNATNAAATVNVAINGLHAGVATTLVFSNGRATAAASVPGPGTAKIFPDTRVSDDANTRAARAHAAVQDENRRLAAALTRTIVPPTTLKHGSNVVHAAAPAVGATRTWRETAYTGLTYNLVVASTCTFSTGRNGVIWVDADQVERDELDPGRAAALAATFCGTNGAYERLVALTGDVWGPAAASTPNYIRDTPALQDLNIVIPGVPQSQAWNGYFGAGYLTSATADPTSNAALAVVLNGWVFAHYPESDSATRNTLIHELKHLANFYQRVISRGAYHSSFLEETSAMLAEDLISPLTTPYTRTEARVSGYAGSGAGVGYTEWTHPEGGSYNVGGSFGAFLHRRYGSSFDRELITLCIDQGTPVSSYDCVNQFIIRHGGVGFEDEFARMGASTLGMMMGSQLPLGFGLPGRMVDDVPLKPIGYFQLEGPFNSAPAELNGTFGATTQTFLRDYIDAGQTTFRRDNVVVPANTTLLVVASEPLSF